MGSHISTSLWENIIKIRYTAFFLVFCTAALMAESQAVGVKPMRENSRQTKGNLGHALKIVLKHRPAAVTVTVHAGKPRHFFIPDEALGAGVDGYEKGDIAKIYTHANISAMKSAGLRPLTYRLRTELGVEAWHWNPEGSWSDEANKKGYWTSSSQASTPILNSNGYSLPRRGNTIDQAGNRGYSRLDDGDIQTFWKSNPYLDKHFTGEDDRLHPQWIVVDFKRRTSINALRIRWGVPYAIRYRIEYWDGEDPTFIDENLPGKWKVFPHGSIDRGSGGDILLKLAAKPIQARFVRAVFLESSGTAPLGSTDIRDSLGYAIKEIYLGKVDLNNQFQDGIRHSKNNKIQTYIFTSSTDPWHRAADRDPNTEQPGLDLVYRSGLTNGLPMLVPVGMLYDTPENAAAEIEYLSSHHYAFNKVELGEEPDGQYITPEDYAALYIQWANAIHRSAPNLQLGGPGFQSAIDGWFTWPDVHGNASWMNRFLKYLKARSCLSDLEFFSFEWYPFDNVCVSPSQQLAKAPELLRNALDRLTKEGVPRNIPWIITEYGYSSYAGQPEVEMPGAIINAEIAAQFLTLGGSAAYLYGYEPNILLRESSQCNSWGNLMLFLGTDDRKIRCPLPAYYGARMLTQDWLGAGDRRYFIYEAECTSNLKDQRMPISAYAIQRPDAKWSLLLLNKDPEKSVDVSIQFQFESTKDFAFVGKVLLTQYSPKQFRWQASGQRGYAVRNLAPSHSICSVNSNKTLSLPAYSLSVICGDLPKSRKLMSMQRK